MKVFLGQIHDTKYILMGYFANTHCNYMNLSNGDIGTIEWNDFNSLAEITSVSARRLTNLDIEVEL